MPCIEASLIQSYLKQLLKEGKKLDSFVLGNDEKQFYFEAFLTGVGTTYGTKTKNMDFGYMESCKGFIIWG